MTRFIQCSFAEHGQRIMEIYNQAIVETTATYEHTPYSEEDMRQWFESREKNGFPIIGAVTDDAAQTLMGFATYDLFRSLDGYNRTVEHSIYLHQDARGDGLGGILLEKLIEAATAQSLHVLVAVIDAENEASIVLHENLGFVPFGTLREGGHKFGQWRDVSFFQLILPGSQTPPDTVQNPD